MPEFSKNNSYNGVRQWSDKVADENYEVFKDYYSYSSTWQNNAYKMKMAYYGRQFSKAEEKFLLTFRQAPLPISVSTAIIESADAAMTAINPTVTTKPIMFPFDEEASLHSRNVAQIFRHVIQNDWYNSLGGLAFDRATVDTNRVGHGLLYVVPRYEHGKFSTDVKHLPYQYFFPDPASTDPLYRDMDNMVYAMPISKKNAYRFVKNIEPAMSKKEFDELFADPEVYRFPYEDDSYGSRIRKTKEGQLLFCQRLTIEEETVYRIVPLDKDSQGRTLGGYRVITKSDFEKDKDLITLVQNRAIKIVEETDFYVVEYTSIGSLGFKKVYPISEYPIIPMVYDHPGRPFPYGRMWYLYPLQRALNKFVMTAILNASILNNIKVMSEEDSIIDEDNWTMSGSMPGVILKYRLPVPGVSEPPEIVKPTPMSDAWLVMPQYLIRMMEYVSGIHPLQQGDPRGTPDTFSTVAALNSAASQKVKRRMAHVNYALTVVGRVMGEYYKNYAPLNGYTTVKSEDGEDALVYNKVTTSLVTDSNGKVRYRADIDPSTNLRTGYDEIRFSAEGSSGTEASTEALILTNLATQTGERALIPEILKRMNFSGVDKVLKDIDYNAKLQQQNSQLENTVKDLESRSKIMMNNINQLGVAVERAKAKGKLDSEITKIIERAKASLPEMGGDGMGT